MGTVVVGTKTNAQIDSTHLYEGARVDSDREGPDVCKPALELDAVGHGRKGEYASAGREEVTCVVISVEADEIRIEHTEKNLAAHRQDPGCNNKRRVPSTGAQVRSDKTEPVDLARREWGMEEESNFDALDGFLAVERVILRLDPVCDGCKLVCLKPACKLWASDEAAKE